jgi:hypothetical protein
MFHQHNEDILGASFTSSIHIDDVPDTLHLFQRNNGRHDSQHTHPHQMSCSVFDRMV